MSTVKILKIGTLEIITIIVSQLERLDFTVQYCVQKMQTESQTEKTLIRLLHEEQSDLGLHCLLRHYLSQYLKVGSWSFEGIIILLIHFLICRKALFTNK